MPWCRAHDRVSSENPLESYFNGVKRCVARVHQEIILNLELLKLKFLFKYTNITCQFCCLQFRCGYVQSYRHPENIFMARYWVFLASGHLYNMLIQPTSAVRSGGTCVGHRRSNPFLFKTITCMIRNLTGGMFRKLYSTWRGERDRKSQMHRTC